MAPPSRRRILPSDTLARFGVAPLYPSSNGNHDRLSAEPPAPTSIHHDGASAPASPDNVVIQPNGIQIGGWKITTQNSAIGDEKRMEELTLMLENIANADHDGNCSISMSATTTSTSNCEGEGQHTKRRRRLCPPEITFLDAIISFQYGNNEIKSRNIETSGDGTNNMTEVRFTASDALMEWAEAHQHLQMKQQRLDQLSNHSGASEEISTSSIRDGFRGVSIINTVDAKIWANRQQTKSSVDNAATIATSVNSEFQYDWTFSSPYASTILAPSTTKSNDGGSRSINNRTQWQPLQQSHIPFHLLQDTSQPILLFDDIHLYEDDLHDNGDVSLNIKVRVMPKCWYVLQRLFVRVDHVCVRCREVRYFCLFGNGNTNVGSDGNVRANTIYRDVMWIEATWEELEQLSLPVDPAAWREEDGNAAVIGGGVSRCMPSVPPLASLLAKLPIVGLPEDLPRFSFFDVVGE